MKQQKQRNLILSLIMMFVMAMCPGAAQAQVGYFENGGYWELEDGVLTIIGEIPDYTQGEGHCPDWNFNPEDVQKVVFKDATVTTFYGFFHDMSNLTSIEGLETLNTKNVTSMSFMFFGCSSLKSLDLSSFNTENVTSMSFMFEGCSSLTSLDLSSFNTKNIINMTNMFYGCSSLTSLDLSSFDTENVSNMAYMFNDCSSLTSLDISSFNTENVTNFNSMFSDCENLTTLKIGKFDVCPPVDDEGNYTSVIDYVNIFNNVPLKMVIATDSEAPKLQDAIFPEDVEVIVPFEAGDYYRDIYWSSYAIIAKDMPVTYSICGTCGWYIDNGELLIFALNDNEGTLDDWLSTPPWYDRRNDVKKVTVWCSVYAKTCAGFFKDMSNLTSFETLDCLKTDNVTNMSNMFYGCSSLESLELSLDPMNQVRDMSSMFYGCSKLKSLVFGMYNAGQVRDMSKMFYGCSKLESLKFDHIETDGVTDMSSMFYGCSSLTSLNLSNFNTNEVTDMSSMFYDCSSLTSLNVNNFHTRNVTDMSDMFRGCSSITSLNVNNFDTGNVTNMSDMFRGCSSLTSLNVSNFQTYEVTDMSSMFSGCSSLTSLNVSNFNTDKVTDMSFMFDGCSSLTSLDISNFNTEKVENVSSMFSSCGKLTVLKIGSFNIPTCHDDIFNNVPLTIVTSTESVPPTLLDAMFPTDVEVVVPSGALEAYKSADYWKLYKLTANDLPGTFNLCGTCGWSVANGELFIFALNGKEGTLDDWSSSYSPWYYNREDVTSAKITGTVNARTCESFFLSMEHLSSIDGLENLKTDNVTNMNSMFSGCLSLSSLDISSFNTDKVTNMNSMFYNGNLDELILGNFDMRNVSDCSEMFGNAPAKILFKSCPYLKDDTFNSLDSRISLALDDKSVISNDANNFPFINGGASYTRSMKNTWGTLVLPFDIEYDQFNGNYRLYNVVYAEENSINIVECPNAFIEAGRPLIVRKVNGDGISIEKVKNVNFSLAINPASGDGWTMDGTYSALTDQTGMYYITGDKLYPAISPITIGAFRAWMNISNAGAKPLTINVTDADGTTRVESVDIDELTTDKGEVYNLNGQRLSAPHKGINIINGKKINFVR